MRGERSWRLRCSARIQGAAETTRRRGSQTANPVVRQDGCLGCAGSYCRIGQVVAENAAAVRQWAETAAGAPDRSPEPIRMPLEFLKRPARGSLQKLQRD